MSDPTVHLPGHSAPPYTEEARADALFHYTGARGLIGILSSGQLWSTSYHCLNDETELFAGKGVLSPLFHKYINRLSTEGDPRISKFRGRGVDPLDYAKSFEGWITATALSQFGTYLSCFCKPARNEDFTHGLLSQWRGYGADGGYALQFSWKKLQAQVESVSREGFNYDLMDVHYDKENLLKAEVLSHAGAFENAFSLHLDEVAKPINFANKTIRSPIAGLPGGPLEALLNYLTHTKNPHFSEESECRLSFVQPTNVVIKEMLPVSYFDRSGLVVPFVQTPKPNFNVLDCIDWIIVGPGPRMGDRMKSVSQMTRQYGMKTIVRPSLIPFTRF